MKAMPEKRPSTLDKAVIADAVKGILDDVLAWLESDEGAGADERVEVERQLVDAAEYACDGFDIAYRLKSHHYWTPDAELVEILDGFDLNLIRCRDRHITEWVKRNNITVDYAIGDLVKFKYPDQAKYTGGEVTRIDTDHAVVHVFCESLGHVRTGVGTYGRLIPVEMIERVDAPAVVTS